MWYKNGGGSNDNGGTRSVNDVMVMIALATMVVTTPVSVLGVMVAATTKLAY